MPSTRHVQIHAETWDEAEQIARSVEISGVSILSVISYQEGDWIPHEMDPDKAHHNTAAIMREVDAIARKPGQLDEIGYS